MPRPSLQGSQAGQKPLSCGEVSTVGDEVIPSQMLGDGSLDVTSVELSHRLLNLLSVLFFIIHSPQRIVSSMERQRKSVDLER